MFKIDGMKWETKNKLGNFPFLYYFFLINEMLLKSRL